MATESKKGLQELRYPEDLDKRKKLDGFTVYDINRGAKDMKDTVITGQMDLESFKSETKYDLRKSLAWDSAFFTSPGFLESEELFHALNSRDSQNGFNILGHDQHRLLSAMSLEPEMKDRIDECNVRKSLAWDNAFFTSEGVLNSEELSLVNQGFKKSGTHVLPGIEELCLSSESNRTTDSDRSSLTSLEVELFEDIRKSMNKSSKNSGLIVSSSRQGRYIDMQIQKLHSPRKLEGAPRLRVKSLPTSRKKTINENQPERTKKEASSSTSTPPSRQFSAASGESDSSSSLKPPKISGRVRGIPTAPTKRVENGKSSMAPVKPNPGKTCGYVLSSTSSSKLSPLSPLSPVMKSMSTCKHFPVCRSSLMSSASRSDSSNVTPNTSSLKRIYSPSFSTLTCSSHSSTSTDQRCHDAITSPDTICRRFCIDKDVSTLLDSESRPSGSHENMHTNICTEETGNDSIPSEASTSAKRSGLRMPSPKIGFFDGNDSLVPAESEKKLDSGAKYAVYKVGTGNRDLNSHLDRSRPRELHASRKPKQSRNTPQKLDTSVCQGP